MKNLIYFTLTVSNIPPAVRNLKTLLGNVADWVVYVVPAIIIVVLVIGGTKLSQADDATDTKEIKERMKRTIIGATLVGGAVWFGDFIWTTLSGS